MIEKLGYLIAGIPFLAKTASENLPVSDAVITGGAVSALCAIVIFQLVQDRAKNEKDAEAFEKINATNAATIKALCEQNSREIEQRDRVHMDQLKMFLDRQAEVDRRSADAQIAIAEALKVFAATQVE